MRRQLLHQTRSKRCALAGKQLRDRLNPVPDDLTG